VRPSAIGQALLAVGDQWTLLILQRAFLKHTRRFADWRDDLGMSESVLAARLKEMVAGDLLEPVPYRNGRTRIEYRLTERALQLWPVLVSIWAWEHVWVDRRQPLPALNHLTCGQITEVELGCTACAKAPVSARDTTTITAPSSTFRRVTAPRQHRRTVRALPPDDPLSYFPATMEILGDKWSTALLAAAFLRIRRFADLQEQLGVAPSILSDRLRRFTELGVLTPDYRLTEKGLAFFGVFAFLVDWAQRWYTGAPESGITISHRACDQEFVPYLRCVACHEPVHRRDVRFDVR
jgi:DNA-binding HxlR family transcriptional regulator